MALSVESAARGALAHVGGLIRRAPLVGATLARLERAARDLAEPRGLPRIRFEEPAGDPGLFGPDSMTWRVHRNAGTLFVGGVSAVLLELAEPRVRSGVWDHTDFRTDPVGRMRRTGLAAMVTTYGSLADVETVTARVRRMHDAVTGETPDGRPYRANDPDLLRWVHATAVYGFLNAYVRYVAPSTPRADQDRYYAESARGAACYGATGVPTSAAAMDAYVAAMLPELRPHPIIDEFLALVTRAPALSHAALPLQWLLVQAAIDLLPAAVQERLGLAPGQTLRAAARPAVGAAIRLLGAIDVGGVPERACRRVGVPLSSLDA